MSSLTTIGSFLMHNNLEIRDPTLLASLTNLALAGKL